MPIEPVKIPQNVYVEDRIIGPVTLRQLIILLGTAGFSYAIWTGVKNQLGASSLPITIVCWIPFLFGLVFSFVRIQGISLVRFLLLMAEKVEKPSIRLWSPRRGISINFQYFSANEEKKKQQQSVVQPHRERLEELSAMLDRGPIIAGQSATTEDNTASPAEPVPPRPVDQSRIRAEITEDAFPFDDIALPPKPAEAPAAQNNKKTMQDILPPSAIPA